MTYVTHTVLPSIVGMKILSWFPAAIGCDSLTKAANIVISDCCKQNALILAFSTNNKVALVMYMSVSPTHVALWARRSAVGENVDAVMHQDVGHANTFRWCV